MRTFSLGAGKDTVVFESIHSANGQDTITGFKAGSGGDVLKVSAFKAKAGDLQFADATATALTVDDGKTIGVLFKDDDGEITGSNVKNSGGSAGDVNIADGKTAVVLVTTGNAGTTSANTYNVYYITGTASGGTAQLVGTVTTDAAALTGDNFA